MKETLSDEDARAFLRTRSIYIATPCFGSQMSQIYTRSLVDLVNSCCVLGIKYAVEFQASSLISQARNSMVAGFLNTSDCTDFLFIDADMGFGWRDVISLLLREEEIIGVPYPRKIFNWDHVVDCLKKQNFNIPHDDLDKLTGGDFCFNLPPSATPIVINLSETLEVREAGTGLMRIKREVFGKIREAVPNRLHRSMEPGFVGIPTYMYFQPEIDPDALEDGDFLPSYISEDFAFCHLARRAGLKVHIAPWVKTAHVGNYVWQGDLEVLSKYQ